MVSDFVFIILLVVLCCKWISKEGYMGWFIVNLLLFGICKTPGIILMQGWRNFLVKPVEPIVLDHFVSGLISFLIVAGFYFWIKTRKTKNEHCQLH